MCADDSSNPFARLAKEFALKKSGTPQKGADKTGTQKSGKNSTGTAGISEKATTPDIRDEAALFLAAVSNITPAKGVKSRSGGVPLAEALAARTRSGAHANGFDATALGKKPGGVCDLTAQEGKKNTRTSDSALFLQAMGPSVKETEAPKEPEPGAGIALPDEDASLFGKAMDGVRPVGGKGRAVAPAPRPATPGALHDPAKALRDLLDGRVEFALHHTDEYMEGHVVGLDPLVLARLRSGQYSPEKHIDLHGMNARQAFDALVWFVKDAYQRGLRTVVVVTGRGKNSPDGIGVLRPMLQEWLCKEPFKRAVLAFCTAKPHDGGPGAVYVLLRKYKKSRGKILWERLPSDSDFPDI